MLRARLLAADWYYGWVVALAGFVAATVLFGLTYSFGVFLTPLSETFRVGSGTLSLLFGVQTFVIYAGSVPGGSFLDAVGARKTALLASALLVAGLVGASQARSFWTLLAWYGGLAGAGMSLLYVVAYTGVPRWFHRHRGLATGLASSGLGVGLLVVAPASASLIELVGWRGAYRWLAVGAGIALAVATYLFADDPAASGTDLSREFPTGEPPRPPETPLTDRLREASAIAASPAFAALFVGWLFVWTPLYILMNHVVRFATVTGRGAAVGVAAISVVGVTTSLSRVGVGFASDRFGRVRTFAASGTLVALAVPALTLVGGRRPFFALVVLFGIGYGGAGALLSPLVAELFGGEHLGTVFGIASVAFAIGGLSAPPLAGTFYGYVGSYTPVFWAAGAVGLLGVALTVTAGRRV